MEKKYTFLLSGLLASPLLIVFGILLYNMLTKSNDKKEIFIDSILNKSIKGKVQDIRNIKERHNGLALLINNEQEGCPELDCENIIKIGDSISKEINSTEFKVYRNDSLIKVFDYNNLKFN